MATELAHDNRRVLCSTCGNALGETSASQPVAPRPSRTSEARELLDRWANSQLFDPYGPLPQRSQVETPSLQLSAPNEAVLDVPSPAVSLPSLTPPHVEAAPVVSLPTRREELPTTVSVELDRITNEILARVEKMTRTPQPLSTPTGPSSTSIESVVASPVSLPLHPHLPQPTPITGQFEETSAVPQLRIVPRDAAPAATEIFHTRSERAPQDDPPQHPRGELSHVASESISIPLAAERTTVVAPTQSASSAARSSVRNLMGLIANLSQILAFVAILGMTAGFTLIVVGTFSSATHLAPTGWLVATISQMLLFLAIVTMVSAGLDQAGVELRNMTTQLAALTDRIAEVEVASRQSPPQSTDLMKSSHLRESAAA